MTSMQCRYCSSQVTWSMGRPFEVIDMANGEPWYQPHKCEGWQAHQEEQKRLQARAVLIDREQRGYL